MRKSLWIVLALLVVSGAPVAHADSFSVTFTSDVALPTAMDVTFPSPTLDITWQGTAFTIAFPSSFLPGDRYGWGSAEDMSAFRMLITDFTLIQSVSSNNVPLPAGFVLGAGNLTFTPTAAAPEPSSVALMLLGVGFLFLMRKRIGQGLPQAS